MAADSSFYPTNDSSFLDKELEKRQALLSQEVQQQETSLLHFTASSNLQSQSIQTLVSGTPSAGSDTLIGDANSNDIDGLGGNDRIEGRGGQDILRGGLGDDYLIGGLGGDQLYADLPGETGPSNDTASWEDIATPVLVSLNSNGNSGISQSNDGNDFFTGIESFVGGTGATDTIDGRQWTANFVWNAVSGIYTLSGSVTQTGTITKFENIVTGSGNDTVTGNGLANNFQLGAGTNSVDGGLGNDTLELTDLNSAGTGVFDKNSNYALLTFNSSTGNGLLTIPGKAISDNFTSIENFVGTDSIGDVADFSILNNPLTIDLTKGTYSLIGGIAGTIRNFEFVIGTQSNDVITGNAANNRLEGGSGNDILNGGLGIDTADYSNFVVEGGFVGVTVTLVNGAGTVTVTRNGLVGEQDKLTGIENIFGGAGQNIITGDGNANVISGGNSSDILDGGAGNDTISGFGGNNILLGGAGDDRINSNSATDYIDGGDGFDLLDLSGRGGTAITLAQVNGSTQITSGTVPSNVIGIEAWRGSAAADNFTGGEGDDVFYSGSLTQDTFVGNGGYNIYSYKYEGQTGATGVTVNLQTNIATLVNVSQLEGSQGNDTLTGYTNLSNVILGGSGNDTITGGNQVDVLSGGSGFNILTGGGGNDWAYYNFLSDSGSVQDFTIDLGNTTGVFNATSGGQGDKLVGIENVIGGAGNDTISGDAGVNILVGGLGDDVLNGGAGDDILIGGAGKDRYDGGSGNDTIDYAGSFGPSVLPGGSHLDLGLGNTNKVGVTVNLQTGVFGGGALGDSVVYLGSDFTKDKQSTVENVVGTSFNDTLTGDNFDNRLDGNDGNDVLVGGLGDDALYGGKGADKLDGGEGDDDIYDGEGNDIVTGGNGDDELYLYEGTNKALAGNGDDNIYVNVNGTNTIDGGAGLDLVFINSVSNNKIALGDGDDKVLVTATNGLAVNTADGGNGYDVLTFTYLGTSTSALTIDLSNQKNNAGAALGSTYTNFEEIHGSDFGDRLIGDAKNNIFYGDKGNDYLDGGAGNDILNGGEGRNIAFGGAGDDVIIGGSSNVNGSSFIAAAGGDGNDALLFDDYNYTPGSNVGLTFDFANGTVTNGNNLLVGTAFSIERFGGTIYADNFIGTGVTNATVTYEGSSTSVDANLQTGRGNAGSSINDTYTNIVNLIGSQYDDILTGKSSATNTLSGGRGNDILVHTGTFSDTLDGGDGSDTADFSANGTSAQLGTYINLTTGQGYLSYTVTVSNGSDQNVVENAAERAGIVGGQVADKLVSIENIRTGDGNDVIMGSAGNNILEGGKGADYIDGGAGIDLVSYEHAALARNLDGSAQTSTQFGVSIDLNAAQQARSFFTGNKNYFNEDVSGNLLVTSDVLVGIEGVIGSAFNDFLTGNAANNILRGGAGNDVLDGQAGNDILQGGLGNDTLTGGLGSDTGDWTDHSAAITVTLNDHLGNGVQSDGSIFQNGAINAEDTFQSIENYQGGSTGRDVIDWSHLNGANFVTADLTKGTYSVAGGVTGTLSGFENIMGSHGSDKLTGDGENNGILGGEGNDTIYGLGGNDYLDGEDGNDALYGGAGNDDLYGGAGNDILDGGAGDDQIVGGAGNDVIDLRGGGSDTLLYGALSDGVNTSSPGAALDLGDIITGFSASTDHINLTPLLDSISHAHNNNDGAIQVDNFGHLTVTSGGQTWTLATFHAENPVALNQLVQSLNHDLFDQNSTHSIIRLNG